MGLSLYRLDVAGPDVFRASALRRERPRDAPRVLRRSRLLKSPTCLVSDVTNRNDRSPAVFQFSADARKKQTPGIAAGVSRFPEVVASRSYLRLRSENRTA